MGLSLQVPTNVFNQHCFTSIGKDTMLVPLFVLSAGSSLSCPRERMVGRGRNVNEING